MTNKIQKINTDTELQILKKYSSEIETIKSLMLGFDSILVDSRMNANRFFKNDCVDGKLFTTISKVEKFEYSLSQGEVQRFIMLEAISSQCELIVMDECLSGLPEIFELEILIFIKENFPKLNILYISHRINDAISRLFEDEIRL